MTAPVVGVLGGGQLGRMLGLAATALGVRCRFLDPSPEACAAAVGPLVVGALDEAATLEDAARRMKAADSRVAHVVDAAGKAVGAIELDALVAAMVMPQASADDRGQAEAKG